MPIRRLLVAGLALLTLVAAGIWWMNRGYRVTYAGANVVLVTIDTLRHDRLGAYGYAPASTPRLDAFAAAGVRFEQAVASVPLTLPSHTSLMTSLDPTEHGVRDNGAFDLPADARLLAEVFAAAGYDTGAFVGAYVLHSRWGLAPGFQTYDDDFDYVGEDVTPGQVERRGDAVLRAALPWLAERGEDPFFAWVHLYDPHAPYAAPDPYGSRFAAEPYDGEVAYTDSLIGELLDALDEQGVADNTIVLITADHGEALGDHGEPGHGLFLYDSTILVPLMLRLPDGRASGMEVPEQVRLTDVAPTLLELADLPVPDTYVGESLAPFLDGGGSARPAYSETFFPRYHFGWKELHALRADGYKYVLAPRPELYDLGTDAAELDNLETIRTDIADGMRDVLEERLADAVSSGPGRLSAEAAQRLRALGYIGSAPAVADGPLPDPKDKAPLFRKLTRAQGLLQSGDPAAAEALLEELVAEDAGVVDGQFTLGNARFAQRDFAGAVEAYTATIELNPEYDLALSNLGLARRRLGDLEGARADFEALLALSPDSPAAHYNLGEMALEEGEPRVALQHFERALQNSDTTPATHFGAGVASLQLGDVPAAQRFFDRVAELAPGFPEVHYYRALVAESQSDPAAAVAEYRAEVERFPNHYRSWFNLSLLLADFGQPADAAEAAQKAIVANPEFARAYVSLGRYLLLLEDPARYEEAVAAASRGLALQPEVEVRALGHFVLADLYNRLGRPQEAQRELALARQAQQEIGR